MRRRHLLIGLLSLLALGLPAGADPALDGSPRGALGSGARAGLAEREREAEADAAHGLQVVPRAAQLLAEALEERVDGAAVGVDLVSVH